MTRRLSETLKSFIDDEAKAASVPADSGGVEELRRMIGRRRTVRAAVAAAVAVVVVGAAAGTAASLVRGEPPALPAASVTVTDDASPAPASPTGPSATPDERAGGSPTPGASPSKSPTESPVSGATPDATSPARPAPTSSIPASAGPSPFTSREQSWAFESLVDGLAVRATPGTGGTVLATVPAGTRFRMYDSTQQTYEDGQWWYQVAGLSVPLPGTDLGWVAAKGVDGAPWISPVPTGCPATGYQDGPATVATLDELRTGLVGTWTGCLSTPWESDYLVTLTFRTDGSYTSHALTVPASHVQHSAVYWGTDQDLPSKTYVMHDLQDDGTGVGELMIAWDSGANRGDVTNLRLMGTSLTFEVFHGKYGPLTYRLTRQG